MAEHAEQNLPDLVSRLLGAGASDATVVAILEDAGWSRREIRAALRAHYEQAAGVTLPKHSNRSRASDAVDGLLFSLQLVLAIIWVVSLLNLVLTSIDLWVLGEMRPWGVNVSAMPDVAAWLLVSGLVYIGVLVILKRRWASGATAADSGVRRWLLAMTLLVGWTTMVISVAVTGANYLTQGGGVAVSLRLLAILAVVGSLVAWYTRWLRAPERPSRHENPPFRVLVAGVMAATIAGVVLQFYWAGPPGTSRRLDEDQMRVRAIKEIQAQVSRYVDRQGGPHPIRESLEEMRIQPHHTTTWDREDLSDITFRRIDDRTYEVCAEFRLSSSQWRLYWARYQGRSGEPLPSGLQWEHQGGRHCVRFVVGER